MTVFEVLARVLVPLGYIRRTASCAFPGIGTSNLVVRALVVRGYHDWCLSYS